MVISKAQLSLYPVCWSPVDRATSALWDVHKMLVLPNFIFATEKILSFTFLIQSICIWVLTLSRIQSPKGRQSIWARQKVLCKTTACVQSYWVWTHNSARQAAQVLRFCNCTEKPSTSRYTPNETSFKVL